VIRVVYFSDAPYFGGAEKYLELLISALRSDLFEPRVLTTSGAGLQSFRERLARMGVETAETHLAGPYDVRGYLKFAAIIRKWKPDLLHINLPGTYNAQAGLVAPIARLSGCRRVVTTEHLAMVERLWKRHLAKRFSNLFVTAVISITQSNVGFLTRVHGISPSRIVVIRNGVNITELDATVRARIRPALGLDDSTFVFLAVGSLTERKGHRYLLDAFARLSASGSVRTALLIVGEGAEEAALRAKCTELNLDKRVFFLGHKEDVQSLILDSDCMVVPSTMEGMPFVILEAMAGVKPVIASRIYGIPEVVVEGETGLLVPPGEADPLHNAMQRLARDRELSSNMGAAGRRRIELHFSHERMAREVESVYNTILSGGQLPHLT